MTVISGSQVDSLKAKSKNKDTEKLSLNTPKVTGTGNFGFKDGDENDIHSDRAKSTSNKAARSHSNDAKSLNKLSYPSGSGKDLKMND